MGISPGERVRKLKAMFASGTMVSMQLSPLVSIKSWRVMAVGSMWCSRNGRIKACKTHQTPWNTLFCIQQQDCKSEDKSLHSLKPYLSKNRKIDWTPRVSPPVNESRRKVCSEYSCNWEVQRLRRRKQRMTVFQFFAGATYRYLAGCTTNVPNENWQVGEWSWRPWEKSRGRHLSILDIFCLKETACISIATDRAWICYLA